MALIIIILKLLKNFKDVSELFFLFIQMTPCDFLWRQLVLIFEYCLLDKLDTFYKMKNKRQNMIYVMTALRK